MSKSSDAFTARNYDSHLAQPLSMIKRYPMIPFVAPFATFIILMGLRSAFPFDMKWEYPVRFLIVSAIVIWVSLGAISWRPSRPISSVIVGLTLFLIWI